MLGVEKLQDIAGALHGALALMQERDANDKPFYLYLEFSDLLPC